MAIRLPQGFEITAAQPIDTRVTLTKQEMIDTVDVKMPAVYFAICKDDGKLYLYNKTNEVDPETGKFRVHEGGSSLIEDVKVDGVSVVTNKIANIDLATPLALKQDKLTAGSGIKIENNVISATGSQIEIDNKTIIKRDGKLQTALGGYREYNKVTTVDGEFSDIFGTGVWYRDIITWEPFASGRDSIMCNLTGECVVSGQTVTFSGDYEVVPIDSEKTNYGFYIDEAKTTTLRFIGPNWPIERERNKVQFKGGSITSANLKCVVDGEVATYHTIDGKYIPIDNESINLNSEGNLTATLSTGALADKLPGAIAAAMQKEGGAEEVLDAMFNTEHFQTTLDNKIDIAISLIQAVESN